MLFLVLIKNPISGSYLLGYIIADNQKEAQRKMVDKLVEAGISRDKIGQEVSLCSELHVGNHTLYINSVSEVKINTLKVLKALL